MKVSIREFKYPHMLIIGRIFVLLFVFWKVVKKTKMLPLAEMDLMGGKPKIDALESTWKKPVPRNFIERVSRPLRCTYLELI